MGPARLRFTSVDGSELDVKGATPIPLLLDGHFVYAFVHVAAITGDAILGLDLISPLHAKWNWKSKRLELPGELMPQTFQEPELRGSSDLPVRAQGDDLQEQGFVELVGGAPEEPDRISTLLKYVIPAYNNTFRPTEDD